MVVAPYNAQVCRSRPPYPRTLEAVHVLAKTKTPDFCAFAESSSGLEPEIPSLPRRGSPAGHRRTFWFGARTAGRVPFAAVDLVLTQTPVGEAELGIARAHPRFARSVPAVTLGVFV